MTPRILAGSERLIDRADLLQETVMTAALQFTAASLTCKVGCCYATD